MLDIGCGKGDVTNHLCEKWKMDAQGTDINLSKIFNAGKKYPNIKVKFGDGEFLDGFMPYTFDGILMRYVLSHINKPD